MSRLRSFFLEVTPDQGDPSLIPQDKEHALKVLRVRPGDTLLGLDGLGQAWELEVVKAERRRLKLESTGAPKREAAPGSQGAPLPWIEVWAPLPKRDRAEDLIGQLTQLGIARYVPTATEHTDPQAREFPSSRETRLRRTAQEALKQCGRLWIPEFGAMETLASLEGAPGTSIVLDPHAPLRLSQWLRSDEGPDWPSQEEPLRIILGPEGGLSSSEMDDLVKNGAISVQLAPHILRIETAALAALAITVERWT